MTLWTKQDYLDSIGRLNTELYAFDSRVAGLYDQAYFKPVMDAIGLISDLATELDNEELFTVPSPFTGSRFNRFLHIRQTQEDLRSR